MRCWRAAGRALALAACLAGCARGTAEPGLSITAMDGTLAGDQFSLALEFEIRLTPSIEEALQNGVPIRFLVETRVVEERPWLWSKTLVEDSRGYTLSHHSLSEQYLIRWPGSETYRAYPSRQAALSVLETPEPWQVKLPSSPGDAGRFAEARLRLDLQALPAPLRLVAYISPDWRVGTGWQREKLPASDDADGGD